MQQWFLYDVICDNKHGIKGNRIPVRPEPEEAIESGAPQKARNNKIYTWLYGNHSGSDWACNTRITCACLAPDR